jgi:hypothetical protein
MKKLLGILVLGLLWCNLGFAEKNVKAAVKLPKDIVKGYKPGVLIVLSLVQENVWCQIMHFKL